MEFEVAYQTDPMVSLIVGVITYIYFAYSLQAIAKKQTHPTDGWPGYLFSMPFYFSSLQENQLGGSFSSSFPSST